MINVGFSTSGFLSIGPQDLAEGSNLEFNEVTTPGAITATGAAIGAIGGLTVTPGALTAAGIDLGLVISNSTKQLVTVTDLSKQGSEITFYDTLSLVTPEIGDIWWVPTTSADGGVFTLDGDGSFTIGPPTADLDTLEQVLFYDLSEQTWHGPVDVTIQDNPTSLAVDPTLQVAISGSDVVIGSGLTVQPGTITVQGNNVGLPLSISPASLTVAGQDIVLRSDSIVPGELSVSGRDVAFASTLGVESSTITLLGQDVILFEGMKLRIEPSTITVLGSDITRNSSQDSLSIGAGAIQGLEQTIVNVQTPIDPVLPFVFNTPDTVRPGIRNVQSDPVLITGSGGLAAISVIGTSLEYQINNGAWRDTTSTVRAGDVLRVRMNSSDLYNTSITGTVLLGTVVVPYTVSTVPDFPLIFQTRNLEVA